WLHLKILEAKIKKLNTVTSSFLINTDFGSIGGPQTNLSKEEVDKLAHEIYFQVNERMSFIKPKDKIISILLFELGNLAELKGESENALRIYKSALTYGYEGDLIVPRMINSAIGKSREYEKKSRELSLVLEKNKNRTALDYVNRIERSLIILSVFSTILLISFIVFFYKWKKLKKSISTS
ncbi:hypothetical protein, partial [Flavobacterium sp.]|uniref:hypothetical protein n=1 Tax=Flavobacterium sp. TaxID=239 RepID=UPI002ED569A2